MNRIYHVSAIGYLFMALEGLINIIYCSLQKPEFKKTGMNLELRLDIEQKFRMAGSLCNGFLDSYEPCAGIFNDLKEITKLRNKLFHSKIDDNMRSILLLEPPFLYTVNMAGTNERFPSRRVLIRQSHVLDVRNVVDSIVSYLVTSLDETHRKWAEKYILQETFIPIIKDSIGGTTTNLDRTLGQTSIIKNDEG